MIIQKTDRRACECPGVSNELWVSGGLLQSWALNVAVHAWDHLREVTIIFITSTLVWTQGNRREGTQLHPLTENWIKDLLSMILPIRTTPCFLFSQSLQSGSFHKPLILIYQKAERLKTTITEN